MKYSTLRQLYTRVAIYGLLVLPATLIAQPKLDKLTKQAAVFFANREYVEAEAAYQQVLIADPQNFNASVRMGRIKERFQDYAEALRWYQAAVNINPSLNDTLYFYIGDMYKRLNKYADARTAFTEFMTRHKNIEDAYYKRSELEILGCDFAESEMATNDIWRLKTLNINSSSRDYDPAILDQRQENKYIAFTSFRKKPGKRNKQYSYGGESSDSDLWLASMQDDSTFTEPTNMGKPINSKFNDGAPTFSPDGMTMYYAIANATKSGIGSLIYESKYNPIKKQWSKPVVIKTIAGFKEMVVDSRGKTKRVPCFDSQPELSADGRTMYFVSDREGGNGGTDIWCSRRQGPVWGAPTNVGAIVNTPFDEATPALDSANTKLYFASKGHIGIGGFDLYYSEGDFTTNEWGSPENLGMPINSSYDDLGLLWTNPDTSVLFTSDRPDGMGSYDIYLAIKMDTTTKKDTVPEIETPNVITEVSVSGLIRDKITQVPIPFATAILYELSSDSMLTAIDTFNTDQNARYNFPLQMDTRYKILGNAPEYFANEVEVSTVGIEKTTELERNIDIELERIIIGNEMVLQNIYYDFDEYYLREDALAELNKLVKILVQNPNITIQLGSHTDSNGSDKYNEELSDKRAKAVVRYLIDSGISPDRLSWRGYGESLPLIFPEQSDVDEQANRRTEFRVLSIDYAPRPK